MPLFNNYSTSKIKLITTLRLFSIGALDACQRFDLNITAVFSYGCYSIKLNQPVTIYLSSVGDGIPL